MNDYEKLLYKCNRQKNQLRKQKIKILEYKEEIKKTEELKIEYSKSIDFISQKANKEIERLNNIINELEKWLSARIDNFNANVSEPIYHEYIAIRLVYDYLQELKGDGSNE